MPGLTAEVVGCPGCMEVHAGVCGVPPTRQGVNPRSASRGARTPARQVAESWRLALGGFIESWIGVAATGVSPARIHDSAAGSAVGWQPTTSAVNLCDCDCGAGRERRNYLLKVA